MVGSIVVKVYEAEIGEIDASVLAVDDFRPALVHADMVTDVDGILVGE